MNETPLPVPRIINAARESKMKKDKMDIYLNKNEAMLVSAILLPRQTWEIVFGT